MQAMRDAGYTPRDINEVVLVGGMTRMPKVHQMVKGIFDREPHKGVNPDEVVAIGAAIQGAQLLLGSKADVLLLDVTPLSLGIETLGGVMTKLIERNTTIPKTAKETFSTADDNQKAVTVKVFQGERPMANDNRLLGHFDLTGIEPAPRGMPKIEVTFDIDANGILKVSAKDMKTSKEANIEVKSSSGLTKEDVEQMRRDAEAHAEEDKHKRELADARNEADSTVWQIEAMLKENAAKIPERDQAPIKAQIERVKQVKDGNDVQAIKQALSDLQATAQAMAQHVHGQPSGDGQQGGGQGGPGGGKDDVIDAEFEVKK